MDALIAEDVKLYADRLRSDISTYGFFDSIHLARDGREAMGLFWERKPKFLLLDVEMPYISGLRVAKKVLSYDPFAMVVLMTAHLDETTICGINRLENLNGCILKTEENGESLFRIIDDILGGRRYFSSSYRQLLLSYFRSGCCLAKVLKDKERRLLSFIGAGYSSEDIAIAFDIPHATVNWRIHRLREKLDVHSNRELMKIAVKSGCFKGAWDEMELIDSYDIYDS